MATKQSEDAQPNEVRAGRKGASVPTIRITSTRPRGRPSIRGTKYPLHGSRFHAFHAKTGDRQTAPSDRFVELGEASAGTRNSHPTRLTSGAPGDEPNPRKRPWLETDAHLERSTVASPQGHPFPRTPQKKKTKGPRNAVQEEVLVKLPPFCRRGREGGRKKRLQWIKKQLNLLQIERGLKVAEHRIVGDTLHVTCFQLVASMDPQTFPSEAASTSSVTLPSRRASPLPRAQIQEHEAMSDANNWTDSSQCFGPSGSNPQPPIVTVQSPSRVSDPSDALRSEIPADSQHPGYSCFSFRSGTLVITANYPATRPHERVLPLGASPKHIEPSPTKFPLVSASEPCYPETQHEELPITPRSNLALSTHFHTQSSTDITEHQRQLPDLEPLRVDEPDEVAIVSKNTYDKPRRLLSSQTHGLISVTARGAISCIGSGSPRRGRSLLAGSDSPGQLVDDACLLDSIDTSYLVLGRNCGDSPIVVLDLSQQGVRKAASYCPPLADEDQGGVSAVTALHGHRMFASGEYNHRVRLWSIPQDPAQISSQLLAIEHSSVVQSLLSTRDTSDKLLSAGADCTVALWDLSSERTINTFKTSNSVYHAHRTPFPFSILLQVAHRELQFEIRDYRLTPERAVHRFGHVTQKVHGRHAKGDVRSPVFACGDRDGVVRFWDLRKVNEPYQEVECFPGRRILQVLFDKEDIAACSEDHHVAFMKYKAERVDVTTPIDR